MRKTTLQNQSKTFELMKWVKTANVIKQPVEKWPSTPALFEDYQKDRVKHNTKLTQVCYLQRTQLNMSIGNKIVIVKPSFQASQDTVYLTLPTKQAPCRWWWATLRLPGSQANLDVHANKTVKLPNYQSGWRTRFILRVWWLK